MSKELVIKRQATKIYIDTGSTPRSGGQIPNGDEGDLSRNTFVRKFHKKTVKWLFNGVKLSCAILVF